MNTLEAIQAAKEVMQKRDLKLHHHNAGDLIEALHTDGKPEVADFFFLYVCRRPQMTVSHFIGPLFQIMLHEYVEGG